MNKILRVLAVVVFILSYLFLPQLNEYFIMREYNVVGIYLSVYSIIACTFMFTDKGSSIRYSSVDVVVVIFIIYVILSETLRNGISLWSLSQILLLAVTYFIGRSCSDKPLEIKAITYTIVISGVIQASVGLMQHTGLLPSNHNLFSLTGSFQNPGLLGGYLSLSILAATGVLLYAPPACRIIKTVLFVSILFMGSVCFLSESRAAWVACIVVGLSMVLSKIKMRKPFKVIAVMLFMCLISVPVYLYKQKSADSRLFIWKVSWQMIRDKPVTGHGMNAVEKEYMHYQARYLQNAGSEEDDRLAANNTYAFNEVIRLTCEFGVSGLILFLISGYMIVITPKTGDKKTLGYVLSAFIVFSLFSYPLSSLPLLLYLPLLTGILSPKGKSIADRYTRRVKNVFAFILAGGIIITLPQWIFYRKLEQALVTYVWEGGEEEYINEVYPRFTDHLGFVSKYAKALFLKEEYLKAIPVLEQSVKLCPTSEKYGDLGIACQQTGNYRQAGQCFTYAASMVPAYVTPKYRLFKLYLDRRMEKEAILLASQIINMEPKIENKEVMNMKDEARHYLETR